MTEFHFDLDAAIADSPHREWFLDLCQQVRRADHRMALLAGFAGVGRRFGYQVVDGELNWRLADQLRVQLLKDCCQVFSDTQKAELVHDLFRHGDVDEQIAVVKSLSFIDPTGAAVKTAVESLRTNVREVFSAMALKNSYPTRVFSQPAFCQMILKCLFLNLDLSHVIGLVHRLDDELIRMAKDYRHERELAGRTVPSGCHFIDQLAATTRAI